MPYPGDYGCGADPAMPKRDEALIVWLTRSAGRLSRPCDSVHCTLPERRIS